jgi:3-hydroxyisobutyrate dehydrogenase-like beta-hydroxyacid dehydrogenase
MPACRSIADEPGEPTAKSAEFVIRRVGVVGLGHMGHAFAVNLIEDGYLVLANDRDPKRITALTSKGAHGAARLSDLADCDAVITSLPDDDALAGVALAPDGLASVLPAGSIHISTSTISPSLSGRLPEAVEAGPR